MADKLIITLFFVLLLLSLWTPTEQLGDPTWMGLARYIVFLMLSGAILVIGYIKVGLRIPAGIEVFLLVVFLSYICLSVFWGVQSADSYIKAVLILNALLTSLAIANILPLGTSLRVVFSATSTFVVLSVFTALFIPSIGVEDGWEHFGKWRGLAGQKNGLASVATFSLIAAVTLPLKLCSHPFVQLFTLGGRIAMVCIAFLAVYMSGSRGGQLIAAVGIFSVIIASFPLIIQRLLVVVGVLFTIPVANIAATTFVLDADKIGVAGVTVDTNSRVKIWEYGFSELSGHELLGFGLSGFWTEERLISFKDRYGWVLDNFHNGYITLIIENGVIGFILFSLAILSVYLLLIVSIGFLKDRYISLSFAYINMYLVINLVENEIGRSTSLLVFIFLVLTFSLRKHVSHIQNI
ncbi:O-antigen ligase family protein [Lentilitoribacter sp. Alg239-R112]|uniref:O-antigen ligase family protein n=1 Tax=Lentilitoribacter sp. Alg239-R112 TaxID=2305987 RepID=UPI0013A709FF|nr:O-antigen ligase family protein [Lentilitoribacter sp. Alg239-R112]